MNSVKEILLVSLLTDFSDVTFSSKVIHEQVQPATKTIVYFSSTNNNMLIIQIKKFLMYSRRPLYICMTYSDAAHYPLADDLIKGHFTLRTPEPVIMPADEYQ